MRNLAMIAAVVTTLGISTLTLPTPAAADSSGSIISMQQAIYVANRIGVIGVNEIQFDDGRWHIEGRDPAGRTINVNVDGRTGEILNVDRW
ncbi:PepSY domain-containing protein [Bradyrhizobium prioriisuperbiae]|uniref:PepSY domain-containing protein n=1 Tax=Bradyrhizobium prioriisuperbiae TaxID=2854389 RepID=UPI0028EFBE48|nr:PepSY domain-containing protein [Bradyrhizobium prioritasuperba]